MKFEIQNYLENKKISLISTLLLASCGLAQAGTFGTSILPVDLEAGHEAGTVDPKNAPFGFDNDFLPPNLSVYNQPLTTEELIEKEGFSKHTILNTDGFLREVLIHAPSPGKDTIILLGGYGESHHMGYVPTFALPLIKNHGLGVILMENPTSSEWIRRNERFIATGFEAGYDTYLTIKAIKSQPETRHIVSNKLHIMAVSLGGNDALFTGAIDKFFGTDLINGTIIGLGGPLDKNEVFRRYRSDFGLAGGEGLLWNTVNICPSLKYIALRYPNMSCWDFARGWSYEELTEKLVMPETERYLKEYPARAQLASKFISEPIQFPLQINQQLKLSSPELLDLSGRHAYVLISRNDPIVLFDQNASVLKRLGAQKGIKQVSVDYGGHIGWVYSYGHEWMENLIVKLMKKSSQP